MIISPIKLWKPAYMHLSQILWLPMVDIIHWIILSNVLQGNCMGIIPALFFAPYRVDLEIWLLPRLQWYASPFGQVEEGGPVGVWSADQVYKPWRGVVIVFTSKLLLCLALISDCATLFVISRRVKYSWIQIYVTRTYLGADDAAQCDWSSSST